jgi:hypothetical protein
MSSLNRIGNLLVGRIHMGGPPARQNVTPSQLQEDDFDEFAQIS